MSRPNMYNSNHASSWRWYANELEAAVAKRDATIVWLKGSVEAAEAENDKLREAAQAVVDSGSMCMDMQVVSIRKFNALAALLGEPI